MIVKSELPSTRFTLGQAILVRNGRVDNPWGGSRSGQSIASIHPVVKDNAGRAQIGAGELLTMAGLGVLVRELMPQQRIQYIDERVLGSGMDGMVWWKHPGKQRVWFKASRDGDLGECNGVVDLPGLVFFVRSKQWGVLCVKGKNRPAADTQLWMAPFYNVWDSSVICTGNVELPDEPSPGNIDAYERAFFGSRFTHSNVNASKTLTRHKGGLRGLWTELLQHPAMSFPQSSLVKSKYTVQSLIGAIHGGEL